MKKSLKILAVITSSLLLTNTALADNSSKATDSWFDNVEFQAEFLKYHYKDNRYVKNYNLHALTQVYDWSIFSLHAGATFTVADGYIIRGNMKQNSDAVGLGPAIVARFGGEIIDNFHISLDLGGSMRFFTKNHPATARKYDFLWRIGPRIAYDFSENGSVGFNYVVYAHASNGHSDQNPGYEMKGFNFSLDYKF
ncbi:hypothetical protein SAMN02910357_00420 [Succinivibrio dextrinosolvens]|uniref:hypothetical protein n=1 Tax=Succinivibrio dextrinosolvens TaxID=83771 RepID=UPI0008E3A3F7|nr:hypothetical protein [Succinivibrio dextrinosolvens]SFS38004.1 hypothetical protein SAMN02910357_00420 [Succinivibrio dextrinosolvens]